MTVNSLIALGGRGVRSPVERYLQTKGQMEQGRVRQAQEQGAYQTMGIRGQQEQRAQQAQEQQEQERQIKMAGNLAKGVVQSDNPALAYRSGIQQYKEAGYDVSNLPPEYKEEYRPALVQMVENAGLELDEKWVTRSRGDALTRVSQKTGKEERVLGATDATGVTKTMEIKPISDTKRRNMGKEFEISHMLDRLSTGYDDKYSGFFSTNIAELAVAAGRRGMKYQDMAKYMTEYQEWKNLVRNSLFGSQLTKPEMAEFEAQTINPAYTSEYNRAILERQRELLDRGKKRAIIDLKASGWTDEMIKGFEGSYESDELTPEEQQELEMRESIRQPQTQEPMGMVPRNPPVAP